MNGCLHYIIILVISSTVSFSSHSQEVKQVVLTKYTQNEGLSNYFISKIIKDSYGYFWIGTQEGLNLFDGREFQIFSRQSKEQHRLGGSFVSDIVEDKKRNWLWVLTTYGDVVAFDLITRTVVHRITHDHHNVALSEKWGRTLAVQNDTLWIGGMNVLSAYLIVQKKFSDLDIARICGIPEAQLNVNQILFDSHKQMWICSDDFGVAVLDRKLQLKKVFHDELEFRKNENRKLWFWGHEISGDTLTLATSWGLRSVNMKTLSCAGPLNSPLVDDSEILSMARAGQTQLLLSCPQGFYLYDKVKKKLTSYEDRDKDDNWFAFTFQTFYDWDADKVWIGTQEGLATFTLNGSPFEAFTKSHSGSTRLKHLYAIIPYSDTEIYCGDENGVFYVDRQTGEIVKIDTTSSNFLLFKDQHSNLFLSNLSGMFTIRGKKTYRAHIFHPELEPLNTDHLHCAIQFNDSLIFFSSAIQKGLTMWNTKTRTIKVFHDDSKQNHIAGLNLINFLSKGNHNELFILTEKSVIKFDPLSGAYSSHVIADKEGVVSNFMDMCETDDSYWFATYGSGLIKTTKQFAITKRISISEGLANACAYRVFKDGNLIVATTNNGICALDTATYSIKSFFQNDGLHGNNFEQLCGYQLGSKIFTGGVNGFTIIEPSRFTTNTKPPVLYWKDIKIDTHSGSSDSCNIRMTRFEVPHDVVQATIAFSGLSYSNPNRVTFAYTIPELGNDWIALDDNLISLIGMPPGTYTLQVKAANEDGIWTEIPLQLTLIYLPKWYQTNAFKISILILGALFIYGMHMYRISQIKKQQSIRKEIASDLHDDIGSTLNTVKIFTHLARKSTGGNPHLKQIEEALTDATTGLRDMIWVLDDNQDTIFELMDRIKKFALPICDANEITFVGNTMSDKTTKALSKPVKRNLFLITKEAINNSIKHSGGSEIAVMLAQTKSGLRLSISDNGLGFVAKDQSAGNGLKNIRYRASQISFSIEITSSSSGTLILLAKSS